MLQTQGGSEKLLWEQNVLLYILKGIFLNHTVIASVSVGI